jgi:tRNA pseudouridine38-40 synthase
VTSSEAKSQSERARQFAITIAYDGTRYGGWQIQPNAKTIQQSLVDAIEQATSEHVHVQGSGRTDSGVHAIGQVGSFALQRWNPAADKLVPAINRYLPRDIVVRECQEVVLRFDPIREARSKRYRYTIRNSRIPDPMTSRYHWWIPKPLNVEDMRRGASYLTGTHDFKSFESLGSPRKSTTRTVYDLDIRCVEAMDGIDFLVEIEADGFLYNMVRNIVGALWSIGSGRYGFRWMETFLESRERDTTNHTAPPQGLCLLSVTYPDEIYLSNREGA